MFHKVSLLGTFWVLMTSPGYIMGLFTEIYIFTGKDDCQRSCVIDPKCEMVAYSKLNFTCQTSVSASPPTADEFNIKRSQIQDQGSYPPLKIKPLVDTCLIKQPYSRECIREGGGAGFTCEQTDAWEHLDQRRKKTKIIKSVIVAGAIGPEFGLLNAHFHQARVKNMVMQRLPVRFSRDKVVRICGTPNTTKLFGINFCLNTKSSILFHMNPRFFMYHPGGTFRNVVLMNHMDKGRWGDNAVQSKDFPFAPDQPFVLTFMRRKQFYVVKMDNYTWKYPDMYHRRSSNRFFISVGLIDTQLQVF